MLSKTWSFFRSFIGNEQGATAIEYGLVAALLAVATITGLTMIGSSLTAAAFSLASKL